jgi:hypothetical protein
MEHSAERSKGIRGRAVRCTVRSVGRKGSRKRACRDPFARRTQHLPQAGASPPIPFKQRYPARSASAGAISVDSRRPRRLALRSPHARDLPSSCPRCLVAPASHQRLPQAASVVPQKDLLEHPPQAARPVPVPPRRMSRKRNKLPVACPRDSGILAAHQLGGPCRIGPSGHRETGGTGSLPGQDQPEGRRPGQNPQVSGQGKRSLRMARLLLDPPRVTGTRQPGAPLQQQQNKKNQTNSLNQKTKP